MWGNKELFVGLSAMSRNSSQTCSVYSWSFEQKHVPHWMHSQPLDPMAVGKNSKAEALEKKKDCTKRAFGAMASGGAAEVMLLGHDEVMLLGHDDKYLPDSGMQVTIAFNHFSMALVQRMPRCRRGYIHVVNNNFTRWEMYAIGGSGNPTINSQGYHYIAPQDQNAKEVTKCVDTNEGDWSDWNWRTERNGKDFRDNIQVITKPAIRRLARRGGVKRISELIYEETKSFLNIFLENVIRDAVTYTEHARRKTVTIMDVVHALMTLLFRHPPCSALLLHPHPSLASQLPPTSKTAVKRLAGREALP
ncbi:hypothetical protein ACFX13_013772 [Malus domestica]